ncbi:MAG: hypothetical protein ABS68_00205 [Niastella sp. SCN 39-18]|nr:MAG: hypothetical protein ABS68_00205 [Niastella sp. SCN 39-18]OJW09114.1 MAG: hypothetical protein BGO53_00200 [Sphingobacteriales bacterium 39-19]
MDIYHLILLLAAVFFLYKWLKTKKDARQLAAFMTKYRSDKKVAEERLRITKAGASTAWPHLFARIKGR